MSSTTTALTESRRRDSAIRRQRVINAVTRLAAAGDDLSVSSVARAARVHRSFIYRHGDLHAAVQDQAARDDTPTDGTRTSRQALQADLANAWDAAPDKPSGSANWKRDSPTCWVKMPVEESGLGAPTDIDALQQRITSLEQQLGDVTVQLAARGDDLDAARNANRELMAQLNHSGT